MLADRGRPCAVVVPGALGRAWPVDRQRRSGAPAPEPIHSACRSGRTRRSEVGHSRRAVLASANPPGAATANHPSTGSSSWSDREAFCHAGTLRRPNRSFVVLGGEREQRLLELLKFGKAFGEVVVGGGRCVVGEVQARHLLVGRLVDQPSRRVPQVVRP